MSYYKRRIAEIAPEYDAEIVEELMRVEHPTLDHLCRERFVHEVRIACALIDEHPEVVDTFR